MPKSNARSPNHSKLHHGPKIQTSRPNSAEPAYVKDVETLTRPQISVEMLRRRLFVLDLAQGAPILRNADLVAAKCGLGPVELLHAAIDRALRPGTSRPNIPIVAYLTMIMRSIASGIAKAQRRARERGVIIPLDLVHEQVHSFRSILDPVQTIERARERAYYAALLHELGGGDPLMAKLVDAIGENMRGKSIQRELGLDPTGLASLRRKLKRKACEIASREGL